MGVTGMSVHLSTDFGGGAKQVALCTRGDSTDPGNTSSTPISGWEFVADLNPPNGVHSRQRR